MQPDAGGPAHKRPAHEPPAVRCDPAHKGAGEGATPYRSTEATILQRAGAARLGRKAYNAPHKAKPAPTLVLPFAGKIRTGAGKAANKAKPAQNLLSGWQLTHWAGRPPTGKLTLVDSKLTLGGNKVIPHQKHLAGIEIPGRAWTINECLRSPWNVNHKRTKALRETAFWLFRQALGPPNGKHLPLLTVNVWPRYTDKRVADVGAGAPMVKAVVDGLVDTKWLKDDNPDYVQRIIFHSPTTHHSENSTYITLTSEHC